MWEPAPIISHVLVRAAKLPFAVGWKKERTFGQFRSRSTVTVDLQADAIKSLQH